MKNLFRNLLYITLGCVLYAVGIAVFLQPNNIAPGGFSGIAIIINYLTNLPTGSLLIAMNIPLFLIAYAKLGRYFVLSTVYSVVLSSLIMDVLANTVVVQTEPLLAAIYGGLFAGLGLGLCFRSGSSTGGSDIITRIVRLYKPHMSIGQIMICTDCIIVLCSVLVFGDFNKGLYAVIELYIVSNVIDAVIEGPDKAKLIYIISEFNDDISKEVGDRLIRGSTFLHAEGAYTKAQKNVLMCAVRRHQIPQVKEIALKYDQNAFMIVTDVREVLGHGFKIKGDKNEI